MSMKKLIKQVEEEAAASAPTAIPSRDDIWTEGATSTLVDAWGERYVKANRRNLSAKDWEEVTEAVNAVHGGAKRRSEVQCRNRIDVVKKKYKAGKEKIGKGDGELLSSCPLFRRFEFLIGDKGIRKRSVKPIAPKEVASSSIPLDPLGTGLPPPSASSIFKPVILQPVRPSPVVSLAVSDVAVDTTPTAAVSVTVGGKGNVNLGSEKVGGKAEEAFIRMSKAMERFVDTYERVEIMKQEQMVSLEEKRMKLMKDLEVERTKMFMDTLVKLEMMKKTKGSGSSDA